MTPTPPDLNIVYADAHLLVLNKPAGLLTVPGRGADKQDCLINRALSYNANARVVHRLDQATSGLVIIPLGYPAQRHIAQQFEQRQVAKHYIAVVDGLLACDSGSVELPLICDWPNRPRQMVDHAQGKPALTHYQVLARDPERQCTRVRLEPVTGRSHQLRVHMLALGHPILGDRLYGTPAQQQASDRLLLHARHLTFTHPHSLAPLQVTVEPVF